MRHRYETRQAYVAAKLQWLTDQANQARAKMDAGEAGWHAEYGRRQAAVQAFRRSNAELLKVAETPIG